jgi:type II secretory pathway component PulM
MKQWLASLDERELPLVMIALFVLVLGLLYLTLFDPLKSEVDRLRSSAASQQALLNWMQGAAGNLQQYRAALGEDATQFADTRPLLLVVDETIGVLGLRKAVTEVKPVSASIVQIRFEKAEFTYLIDWLVLLKDDGLAVKGLQLSTGTDSGFVNGSVEITKVGG